MPGSASSVPIRTLIGSSAPGIWANSDEPQRPQKSLAAPSGGSHRRTSSLPATMRSDPGARRALGDAAVPERRWQRVQWQ